MSVAKGQRIWKFTGTKISPTTKLTTAMIQNKCPTCCRVNHHSDSAGEPRLIQASRSARNERRVARDERRRGLPCGLMFLAETGMLTGSAG